MFFLLLATLATMAAARPSYIAVPADQIAFVDLSSLHVRRPRQVLLPPHLQQALYQQEYPIPVLQHPVQLQQYQQQQYQQQQYQPIPIDTLSPPPEPVAARTVHQEPEEAAPLRGVSAAQLSERPADFGEYVDFGAHTGDNGAFGWYADYPINNHDDSGFRK